MGMTPWEPPVSEAQFRSWFDKMTPEEQMEWQRDFIKSSNRFWEQVSYRPFFTEIRRGLQTGEWRWGQDRFPDPPEIDESNA